MKNKIELFSLHQPYLEVATTPINEPFNLRNRIQELRKVFDYIDPRSLEAFEGVQLMNPTLGTKGVVRYCLEEDVHINWTLRKAIENDILSRYSLADALQMVELLAKKNFFDTNWVGLRILIHEQICENNYKNDCWVSAYRHGSGSLDLCIENFMGVADWDIRYAILCSH